MISSNLLRKGPGMLLALAVATCAWSAPLLAHHCKGNHFVEGCPGFGGGGGGGGGGEESISLACDLASEWGMVTLDSFQGDTLGPYTDGVDKVGCGINGPSSPWPLRLWPVSKGNPDRAPRRIDIYLDEGSFVDGTGSGTGRDYIPDMLFNPAAPDADNPLMPALEDTEIPQIQVRPYRTQNADGIHLLDPASPYNPYEMAYKVRVLDENNMEFHISLASRHIEGNEKFSGISCQSGDEASILANAPGGPMQDISVFIWPDANNNGVADDGYTVTTGLIQLENPLVLPPEVIEGTRVGAICSFAGPNACANGEFCNFLGYVDLQVTFDALPTP